MPLSIEVFRDLRGADLVAKGLDDLAQGKITVKAALVSVGRPRLETDGLLLPSPLEDPEEQLYLLLEQEHGDTTHGVYNALIRRLVSFERALSQATRTA